MPSERDFYNVSLKVFLNDDKGETLILECENGGRFVGFHDLPGGRIEKNEFNTPFDEIIKREIMEELGEIGYELALKPVALSRMENPKRESPLGGLVHWLVIFFEAKYISGDIKISEEHTGFKWVKLSKENIKSFFMLANLEGAEMYLDNVNKNI
ncbi:MAG: NUDIX domain-containing protein [bacterium]|nr:NUDIX domain-containing protein [bacterium]